MFLQVTFLRNALKKILIKTNKSKSIWTHLSWHF